MLDSLAWTADHGGEIGAAMHAGLDTLRVDAERWRAFLKHGISADVRIKNGWKTVAVGRELTGWIDNTRAGRQEQPEAKS